jgi:hypothetical protein
MIVKDAWYTAKDDLFGPYRYKLLKQRGTCFACGEAISDDKESVLKERGGTLWMIHLACPGKSERKRR